MRRGRNLGIIAPPPASATAPEVMPRCRAGAGRVPLALACGNGMRDRPCRPGAWLATRWPWHLTAPGRGAGPPQCRAWRAVRRETPFLRRLQVECNGLAGGVPPRHSVCFATGSPFCSRLVPTTRFRPRDMAAGHLLWGDAMGGGLLKGSWASRRDLGLARLARLGRHGARMWSANGLAWPGGPLRLRPGSPCHGPADLRITGGDDGLWRPSASSGRMKSGTGPPS